MLDAAGDGLADKTAATLGDGDNDGALGNADGAWDAVAGAVGSPASVGDCVSLGPAVCGKLGDAVCAVPAPEAPCEQPANVQTESAAAIAQRFTVWRRLALAARLV